MEGEEGGGVHSGGLPEVEVCASTGIRGRALDQQVRVLR